ncbi:MAG: LuxR C-terminal-related transcriptional regulator [Nitrospirae bacterium]|nr:LuxR C-terminal-related transcriptional regulator [Nitrospirota bacterium]
MGEIMHHVRNVQIRAQLPSLVAAIEPLIPHEFTACGSFYIPKNRLHISHTSYNAELNELYVGRGFVTDPSIQLLERTQISTVSSEDCLDLVIPKEVTSLKLDFGVKTCLSIGVRGVLGFCTYFALSNFDQRLLPKLRSTMQILAPHFHLAYMRATSWSEGIHPQPPRADLTAREEEIMRWVAEGKTNWEISIILHVSLNTVKFHLKNIYQKLGGVENRWSAVAQWQGSSSELLPPDFHKQKK